MKRQTFTLRPAAVLAALFVALNLWGVNTIIHTATYDYTKMTTGTDTLGGVTYLTVNYEGLYNYGEPGMPSLPVDHIDFSVPWNATNFSVTATLSGNLITNNNFMVYPCQELRTMSDTTPVTITPPDLTAYANYPQQNAWVVDEGFLAGENHIVTVAVMPVSCVYFKRGRITTNQLKKAQQVRLVLHYDLSDSLAMYPIVRNDSALRAEGYRLTQSMVVNPANVEAYAPTDMTLDPMDVIFPDSGDGLNGGGVPGSEMDPPAVNDSTTNDYGGELSIEGYPYLIVTTPELLHSVRRIAALKRQKGYNVKVVTMEDVLNSPYSGDGDLVNNVLTYTDDAGKLRQYLRNCFRSLKTEYVLLVGNGVPYREYLFPLSNYSNPKMLDSDVYLSDLNSDWSVYDNWTNEHIDIGPELYIGRIIAKDESQIRNYTDKLLRYELNPGNGSTEYLRRAFYSQSYDMRHGNEASKVSSVWDLIIPLDTLMQESDNFNDMSKFPSGQDIINKINATQYGFLSFHHHGDPAGLLTYGQRRGIKKDLFRFLWALDTIYKKATYNYNDDPLTCNGLNNLENKYFPSICYSTACKTMPFRTLPGYERVSMNFGESFTTGKDYGGPIFIGNSFEGISPISGELEAAVGVELLKKHFEIGKANALAKKTFFNTIFQMSRYVTVVQNLLGDPSLEIWTDEPHVFSNISLSRTDNSITVSGIDVGSTIIAFYNNNGEIMSDTISTDSVTFSSISPNSTVILYKHNCIPYIAPMVLQNFTIGKNQYVIASDVTAGNSVDNGHRTDGAVIVKSGVEYEIEAAGTVTLQDGFKVEKGATFAVYPPSF